MLQPFHSRGERDGFGRVLAADDPRTGFALQKELPVNPEPPSRRTAPSGAGLWGGCEPKPSADPGSEQWGKKVSFWGGLVGLGAGALQVIPGESRELHGEHRP